MCENCHGDFGEHNTALSACEFCGKTITRQNDLKETLEGTVACKYCFDALELY